MRDATGTVESIPLIVASILSKKLAAGLDALVMDVKFGSGAFMARREEAEELATALVEVAGGAGLPTVALLTDMNQPLGTTAGNALEVAEAVAYLTGDEREPRLHEVTMALAASLLVQGGLAGTEDDARERAERALASGAAAERFARMVTALGGPADLLERPGRPPRRRSRPARRRARARGRAGRRRLPRGRARGHRPRRQPRPRGRRHRPGGRPDALIAPLGAEVGPERPLAIVHARDEASADAAAAALRAAVPDRRGAARRSTPVGGREDRG